MWTILLPIFFFFLDSHFYIKHFKSFVLMWNLTCVCTIRAIFYPCVAAKYKGMQVKIVLKESTDSVWVWHTYSPLEGANLRGALHPHLHFISSSLVTPAPHYHIEGLLQKAPRLHKEVGSRSDGSQAEVASIKAKKSCFFLFLLLIFAAAVVEVVFTLFFVSSCNFFIILGHLIGIVCCCR